MAEVKKTVAKEAVGKSATEAKKPIAEVKKPEEVKTPEVKAPEVKKETSKKAPAKKPASKKTIAKKAAETNKPAAIKAEVKTEVKASINLQFDGKSYSNEDFMKMAKDVWVYDLKHETADLKSIELYVKPEESIVYYVMNDIEGSFYI